MDRSLHHAAFLAALAAVGWVAAGYVGSNPWALTLTALIAAFFVMGALELQRFRAATATLSRALADLPDALPALGPWLARLHPSLQNAVRLRIEGERVALPGPSLTPYLAGLLVLLGMLGTFLGMVVTLNGTGTALDHATDVATIRASLSAPVKGLGLAFGTSIAGVAASAMLGLMSALARRDRLEAAQGLDARTATSLRAFTPAHRREASHALQLRQAEMLPLLVDRLQAMMEAMERQGQGLHERLVANQEGFHGRTQSAFAELAASVDRSLTSSLGESARLAGETIRPLAEATMAGIARESAALHEGVAQAVQRQLDGVSTRFEAATATVAGHWQSALAEQQRSGAALTADLRATLDRYAQTFEQRSASLVDEVSSRLASTASGVSDGWRGALAEQRRLHGDLSRDARQALAAAGTSLEAQLAALLRGVAQAHTDLQAELASRDRERLAAWTESLAATASALQRDWLQAGEQAAGRQQEVCATLERTALELTARTEAQSRETIAEVARLVQAASEAPRAAAEVIGELRRQLSDGMARDNAMLEERGRLLETLGTLLDAVHHAAGEQRAAIDALVASSADLLERVGTRFGERAQAEADRMAAIAAQLGGSAVEVASLGEALGFAVQHFGQSNEKLAAQLQRVEAALSQSLARSDEQLAYYVAQAREVIDLSLLSQKQIVEDLQQLARRKLPAATEA